MNKILTTVLLSLQFATASHAASDQERAALTNFLSELDALKTIIDEAKRTANDSEDFRFDYPALQTDLYFIREGVLDYLEKSRREPRELPPLSGDYEN
jgi:RAQPRD family integrative conjugative element protein